MVVFHPNRKRNQPTKKVIQTLKRMTKRVFMTSRQTEEDETRTAEGEWSRAGDWLSVFLFHWTFKRLTVFFKFCFRVWGLTCAVLWSSRLWWCSWCLLFTAPGLQAMRIRVRPSSWLRMDKTGILFYLDSFKFESNFHVLIHFRSRQIIDDFREAYYWLWQNTHDDSRVMSWWDYGYQIAGMGNRTTLVDNNTWNNSHIALVREDNVYSTAARYSFFIFVLFRSARLCLPMRATRTR